MVKAEREPETGRILIRIDNGADKGFVHVMPATARQILLALDECLNVPERAPVSGGLEFTCLRCAKARGACRC